MQRSASLRSFNDPIYASRNVYETHNPQAHQAHNQQHGPHVAHPGHHGHGHQGQGHQGQGHQGQGQADPRQIYGHHVPRNNSRLDLNFTMNPLSISRIYCEFTIKIMNLRVVQTQAILFLKSMSDPT